MRFLVALGGFVDHRFGILTSPANHGTLLGIKEGMDWAADVGCIDGPKFVKRFDYERTYFWLIDKLPYKETCLFVTIPDVVGDAHRTIQYFKFFANRISDGIWPIAFVAQDGLEWDHERQLFYAQDEILSPDTFQTFFVGGSTDWKLSHKCHDLIMAAQSQGKHIHIGRVNWYKRYKHFRDMEGSDDWTCDGTRHRFEKTDTTINAWASYMEQPKQLRFPVPNSNNPS